MIDVRGLDRKQWADKQDAIPCLAPSTLVQKPDFSVSAALRGNGNT